MIMNTNFLLDALLLFWLCSFGNGIAQYLHQVRTFICVPGMFYIGTNYHNAIGDVALKQLIGTKARGFVKLIFGARLHSWIMAVD
ncbi:hypothetical protein F5X99DRAFT_396493 [Biscogniauxia marginata]|nr:hypothetical protein F5X99DRAFT_396493 [Biscogniauxia marginata]